MKNEKLRIKNACCNASPGRALWVFASTSTAFKARSSVRGLALLLVIGLAVAVISPVRAEGVVEPTPVPLGASATATVVSVSASTATPTATVVLASTATATPTPTVTPLWATDTPTPTATWTSVPDCADLNEPNNEPGRGPVLAIGEVLTGFTLSPAGDRDFFLLWGKGGVHYRLTSQTSDGVDTRLRVYDPTGAMVAENDDYQAGNPAGEVQFRAPGDGWFAVAVDSPVQTDWGCRRYQLSVVDTVLPTAVPQPTRTPTSPATAVPASLQSDVYEPNYDFGTAANIGVGVSLSLNFNAWPAGAEGVDNDFFRLYVKQGQKLRIETTGLAAGLDTNLILYRENGEVIAGNDDCKAGELRSCLDWEPDATGLVYVLTGPAGTVPEALSTGARSYTLSVRDTVGETPAQGLTGSSGSSYSRATPATSRVGQVVRSTMDAPVWRVTPLPTATPMSTPTPTPPPATATPQIQVRTIPLGPPTPTPRPPQSITIELNVYQDQNNNRAQDVDEAVQGVSIRVADGRTNQLLTYALTDAYGHVALTVAASDSVRLSVPFLAYSREVRPPGDGFVIRLDPLRLPSIIP